LRKEELLWVRNLEGIKALEEASGASPVSPEPLSTGSIVFE